MTADRDYEKMMTLIRKYVELEKSPYRVRPAIFYVYVESELKYEFLDTDYEQSKVMKEVRNRYKKGQGQPREPLLFYEYFYRKFREQIKQERERVTGHPYSKNQRFNRCN